MEAKTFKRAGKWAAVVLGGLALLLLIVLVGVLLLLQTQYGRDRVAAMVEELTRDTPYQARLTGLGGAPPWRLEAERLEFSDVRGTWLVLEEIRIGWAAMDALRQVYRFPSVRAERIHWRRMPQGDDAPGIPEEPREEIFSIPELPSVKIGKLQMHRLFLDEELFGRAQVLTVEGELDTVGDPPTALLAITAPNGEGDGIVVDVERDEARDRLSVRVRVQEEPGGIVGGLLGLPDHGPIVARVSGEGPLRDWQGEYSASIGGYGRSEGKVGLAIRQEFVLAVSGMVEIERERLPKEAAELLGAESDFSIRLTRTDETLRLEEAVVRAGPVGVDLEGAVAVAAQSLDVQIKIAFDEITGAVARCLEERGIRLENPGPVQGTISGSLRQPEIEADLAAERLAIEQADLANPRIGVRGQLLRDSEAETTGFSGIVTVGAQSLRIPDLPPLSPVDGTIKLSTPDFQLLAIPELTLNSPGLNVTGSGTLRLEDMHTEGTIDVRISDPDKLTGLDPAGLPERLSIRAGFGGSLAPADLLLDIDAAASGLGRMPEAVGTLAGDQIALAAHVGLSGSEIRAEDLVLQGNAVELRGEGRADLDQDLFSARTRLILRDLALLPGDAQGSLSIDSEAAGRFEAFSASGAACGRDVRVGGEPLEEPVVSFNLTGIPAAIEGQLGLTAGFRGQPVEASAGFALREREKLTVEEVEATVPGLSLSGDLRADLAEMVFTGGVRVAAEDLSFVAALTGLDLTGRGSARVELLPVEGRQRATVDLDVASLSFEETAVAGLVLSGRIADVFEDPRGAFEIGVEQARLPSVEIARLDASISGDLSLLEFRARAEGLLEQPFDLAAAGAATLVEERRELRLDTFGGEYAALPILLERPATLLVAEDLLRLSELVLRVDRGTLAAEGELRREEVKASLALRDLPLEVFSMLHPIPVGGILEGDVLLTGSLSAPLLEADFASNLAMGVEGGAALQSMVQGSAQVERDRVSVALSATGLGPEPVRAEASFPAFFGLRPFAFEIPPDGQLQGSLIGEVDLQNVARLVILEGHSVAGRIAPEIALNGTVSDPLLQGRIVLADGRYENYGISMLVDRINATLLATGREIVLESFRARDGERGRMSAEGALELDPDRSFPFRTEVAFRSFQALRNPDLSTQVSGNILLAGDAESAKAGGTLTMDPFNLGIPDRTAPAIAQLEVKEINVAPGEREIGRNNGPAYRIDLDLALEFPARFFIRGRGLDAEFQGKLAASGTASEPVVRGTMSVVRGDFAFLGRRFELTEANVIFTGANPPVPILDVTAEWFGRDITVEARLTGSAMEPTIALESDPPLPSDEVLSRVIFGRSATELTPLQALRLANALRVLATGGGDGFDIFGTLRTAFGLDELEFREEADGTALDVGRYLHENVYLRLTKGLGTGRDKVSVEVELHRYISVESEVGTDSQGGIGINYRRNY